MNAFLSFIVSFIPRAVVTSVPLLYGCSGEILTEKSGNLNLGIPGVMYVGAISGVIGSFFYESKFGAEGMNAFLAIMIPLCCSLLGSLAMGIIYCFLTVTLRANQNVTGLAMTTFGVGIGNFFGGSLIKLSGLDIPSIALSETSKYFSASPADVLMKWMDLLEIKLIGKFFAASPTDNWVTALFAFLGNICEIFLSYGFLCYFAFAITIVLGIFIMKTRTGLHLRAVGESPATADAAGINVGRYKYLSTCVGCMIAGLGGLYYVMDYASGVWSNDAFGDRGWLAIALVIFCIWRPNLGILASLLFGGLYIIYLYIPVGIDHMEFRELYKMIPFVITLVVLVITSMKNKRENQPPESLGLSYFREER